MVEGIVESHLELCVVRHHSLETNTDTLDNTQENRTHDGRVPGSLVTATDSQRTTSEETSDNCSNRSQKTRFRLSRIADSNRYPPVKGT